jgi:hypothetical protein
MNTEIDKNIIKEYLKEIIEENPTLLKNALREIVNESNNSTLFDQFLQKNFEEYEETFKALA